MQPGPKAQNGGAGSIVAYAVGTPYPPCTVLLQDLKPMGMHELRMDTHHRGRVLTVSRWGATPVVKLKICSWTVVQEVGEGGEGGGEVDRLEVGLFKDVHGVDILESGEVFKVLEPWFTVGEQGEPTIRIDHRSDLVCIDCTPSTADKIGQFKNTRIEVTKIAREYKEEGNAALKQRNLPLAYSKYTRGLEILWAAKEDIAYDLFRNRAHVNLLLDRLDGGRAMHLPLSLVFQTRNTESWMARRISAPVLQLISLVTFRKRSTCLRSSSVCCQVKKRRQQRYVRLNNGSRNRRMAVMTSRNSRPVSCYHRRLVMGQGSTQQASPATWRSNRVQVKVVDCSQREAWKLARS